MSIYGAPPSTTGLASLKETRLNMDNLKLLSETFPSNVYTIWQRSSTSVHDHSFYQEDTGCSALGDHAIYAWNMIGIANPEYDTEGMHMALSHAIVSAHKLRYSTASPTRPPTVNATRPQRLLIHIPTVKPSGGLPDLPPSGPTQRTPIPDPARH